MGTATQRVRLEIRGNLRKFFTLKDPEIVLGGPAGTGKTRVLLERQHLLCGKYPGSRGLIVRKFRSSMNETVLHCLNNEVFKDENGKRYIDAPIWRERDQKYIYDNGSEIVVAGMDDPSKVLSSMYDWFYWNEAIEAKRAEWEMVMSRLRNFKIPYQQALGDTNPGPPSHWIKQFGNEGKLTLLETTHKDNPVYWDLVKQKWTRKGQAYINGILERLTGLRRERLLLGKWVLAEGQVYDEFNHETHVCPRFLPPRSWPRYWVFDFGWVDPFVWQEWVEDPDTGIIYLHRELYHSELRVQEACEIIKQVVGYGNEGYTPPMALICDHDAENRATLEKEFQYLTLAAHKPIHAGINAVKNRLAVNPKLDSPGHPNGRPRLYIMENAGVKVDPKIRLRHWPTSTLEEVESYVWDVAKMDLDKYKDNPVDKFNHGMDAMRYMVAFLDNIAVDPQEAEQVIHYNDLETQEQMRHYIDTMISWY